MKVVIVHDFLVGGGAEKVVEQLHKLYPQAPIYTSCATDEWRKRLDGKVVTGWLQGKFFMRLRKFIPVLRIWWFTHLDLSGYDLVISSSGAEAKGVRVPEGTLHINYCHAPTHYYWSRYESYLKQPGFGAFDPLGRLGLRVLVGPLRKWDYKAAQRPDYIIANSTHTKEQIKKYYGREAAVIQPPVDIARFKNAAQYERNGLVVTGRQTPYKRFDIAVAACTKLGLPLTVMGKGPDHTRLKQMAGPTVTFMEQASDKVIVNYVQRAKGYLFPGIDDFGISAVEALAAGTPVLAYQAGGALDYITPGKNGAFFTPQTTKGLISQLENFYKATFNARSVAATADKFSEEAFRQKLSDFVSDLKQIKPTAS